MDKVLDYIEKVTGKKSEWLPNEKLSVPKYLSMNYEWKFVKILNFDCLLIQVRIERLVIDNLLKHLLAFEAKTERKMIFLFEFLTAEQRARLISKQIPFIVTNIQMYLPFVLLDFRKESIIEEKKITKFTPSNQLVFLAIFYLERAIFFAKDIEKQCEISAMTVNRALKLLAKLKVIQMIGTTNNTKYKIIKSKREMFETVEHLLINPIRKRFYIETELNDSNRLAAGEYALSKVGMLSYNKIDQYAIDGEEYREIRKKNNYFSDHEDGGLLNKIELQVWFYNPKLVRDYKQNDNFPYNIGFTVDILSLYVSLINIDDERLQIELENLINRLLED